MTLLSAGSLLLAVVRELAIARELRATGAADLFLREVAVIGAVRWFTIVLFRARWLPMDNAHTSRELLRKDYKWLGLVSISAVTITTVIVGPRAWNDPSYWLSCITVGLLPYGGALRVMNERAGRDLLGFVPDWLAPLGAIGTTLAFGHTWGAVAPAAGLLLGLLGGTVLLGLGLLVQPREAIAGRGYSSPPSMILLMLDTFVYWNLSLVDAGFSHLYAEGEYARLNYAYLFVNALLAVPLAASTLLPMRLGASPSPTQRMAVLTWSVGSGALVGAGVATLAWLLGGTFVGTFVDRMAGWQLSERTVDLVLVMLPFAALRQCNTVARQLRLTTDPAGLLRWDFVGLGLRVLVLAWVIPIWGIVASPLGLAVAELFQIPAWWRVARVRSPI